MSSFKKALQTRAHKERSQPSNRQHLGLLEKKKDYIVRAKDHNKKQAALKLLREKAAFRNPDEFYFKMENTQQREGVHRSLKQHVYTQETLSLLKTQDQNYVNYVRSVNRKKMEKLKEEMHMMESEDTDTDTIKKHSVFVDSVKDVKEFNAAKHFDTDPRFMQRVFNRPTKEMLSSAEVKNQMMDPLDIIKQRKQKGRALRELESRMEREDKLFKTKSKMDMQKNMMGKGTKKKVGEDKDGAAIYKWKQVRST